MTETRLFQSVYDNYKMYTGVVGSVLGNNSCFVEDVISDCCIKITTGLRAGKIDINDISFNGKINSVYFKSVVLRKAIDWQRSKKNKCKCVEDFPVLADTPTEDDSGKYIIEDIRYIREKLYTFGNETASNRFHVDVFNYWYFGEENISSLSNKTTISRARLTNSKNIIKTQIKTWLKEK